MDFKRMKNIIFLFNFIFCQIAFAGFPPTSSKLSGDSSNITTFNYQFPNFTGTHTGITVSLGINSIAGGGTGLATTSQNFAFLGPTSGSGAPSWRLIAAGDLTFNVITLGAFGSTPNSNGASIATNILTMQPADASHPGSVSLSSQVLGGGDKTAPGNLFTITDSTYDLGAAATRWNNAWFNGSITTGVTVSSSWYAQMLQGNSGGGGCFRSSYGSWSEWCFDGISMYTEDSGGYTGAKFHNNGTPSYSFGGSANTIMWLLTDFGTVVQQGPLTIGASTNSGVTITAAPTPASYNFNLPTTPGTSGQLLSSGGGGTNPMTWVAAGGSSGLMPVNLLINSDMVFTQRIGTTVVPANGAKAMKFDRWWVNNALGAAGVVTGTSVASPAPPTGVGVRTSSFHKISVTTAPTTAVTGNVFSISQFLENQTSQFAYSGTVSGSAWVYPLGNITSVTVAIVYNTTQVSTAGNTLGSASCALTASTWTLCPVNGISVSTTPTRNGVIGIAVQSGSVSTGHTSDVGNGFNTTALMLNIGSTVASWAPASATIGGELQLVQRFCEKNADITSNPSGTPTVGALFYYQVVGGAVETVSYKVPKVTYGTTTIYSAGTGTVSKCYDNTTSTDVAATTQELGLSSFQVGCAGLAASQQGLFWITDSEF